MRRALIAMGLLASTGLTGCDFWDKPAPPPPAAVTCNCTPPIRGAIAPEPAVAQSETRHRHSAHRYSAHGYTWHERYAERSVETYGYSSQSRRYDEDGGSSASHSASGDGGSAAGHYRGNPRVWADGYGRRHVYDASAAEHYAYQSQQRIAQTPERLDPWHGYDEDWDY